MFKRFFINTSNFFVQAKCGSSSDAVAQRCFVKKVFLEISQNSQENNCARISFFPQVFNFIKKRTLAQVFSCEFYEISQNTFSYRTPPWLLLHPLRFLKFQDSNFSTQSIKLIWLVKICTQSFISNAILFA